MFSGENRYIIGIVGCTNTETFVGFSEASPVIDSPVIANSVGIRIIDKIKIKYLFILNRTSHAI